MLSDAIQSLLSQTASPAQYEIIVVDNHSTDDTTAVVQAWQASHGTGRLHLLHEPRLGLSHARNTGVQAATGEIIALLDDDGVAEVGWLAELLTAYETFPDAWAIGGKIVPAWEGERPSWLTDTLLPQLSMLDLGDTARPLKEGEGLLYGANCSFRRCVFDELGLFRTDLGRHADQMLGSEETELQIRILRHGKHVIYTPHAIVHHRVTLDRLQPRYFIRLAYDKGRTRARLLPPDYQFSALCWQVVRGSLGVARQWLRLFLKPFDRSRQVHCMRVTAGWVGFIREASICRESESSC
jgi:glycosyltransferase involved in cell wall biosynthesis